MAQIHRFGDDVALQLSKGSTRYFTPTSAATIGTALIAAAIEITAGTPFSASKVGTTSAPDYAMHEVVAGVVVDSPRDLAHLLTEALAFAADEFDDPEAADGVDGGDMVEWFAGWRLRLRTALGHRSEEGA